MGNPVEYLTSFRRDNLSSDDIGSLAGIQIWHQVCLTGKYSPTIIKPFCLVKTSNPFDEKQPILFNSLS